MKSTRFLLAALAVAPFCATPLLAAPTVAPMAPTQKPANAPAPVLDAAAIQALDESVKAYAAMDSMSQGFAFLAKKNGEVLPKQTGTGTLEWMRPNKVRLNIKSGDENTLFVGDGTTFILQVEPDKFQKQPMPDGMIVRMASIIPGNASLPFTILLDGKNPLAKETGLGWQSAKLETKDGLNCVDMVLMSNPALPPLHLRTFIDPQTKLIARTEYEADFPMRKGAEGKPDIAAYKLEGSVVYTPNAAKVVPTAFDFVTPAGATLVDAPEEPKQYDPTLIVGATPFALSEKSLDGKAFSLANYKGKVVLLDFWATWCGPCVGELPNVQANYDKYHAKGFDIVGISLDEDEDELNKFIADKKMPWAQLFDGKGWENADAAKYGVKAIPFTLLVGKDGKIAAVNPRGDELEPAIQAAMAK